MVKKIYRCKVWTAAWIHFRADDKTDALSMATRYFADRQECEVEFVEEVNEREVEEDMIFSDAHLPNITIN